MVKLNVSLSLDDTVPPEKIVAGILQVLIISQEGSPFGKGIGHNYMLIMGFFLFFGIVL